MGRAVKNRPRQMCRGRFLLYTAAWHIIWRESHSPNRHPTISQIFQQPCSNHDTTILRVESKNDSDSTIPHPRSMREQGRRQGDCRRKVRRHRYGCPRCSFCRESSTQRSRKRVTFVMRPATPCPVPSKKRQRFNPHPPAEHPPIRPHHKGLPPTIMLSYLFAAEK